MKTINPKTAVVIRIFSVAVLLAVAAFCFTSTMLARYVTTGGSNDAARTAKFSVSMAGNGTADNPVELSIDGINDQPSAFYEFTVTSGSEVAVTGDLTLTMDRALPEGVTMTLINVTKESDIPVPEPVVNEDDSLTLVFRNFASFAPVASNETQTFRLTFTGGDHGSIVESSSINFSLQVTMSQTEQGGTP